MIPILAGALALLMAACAGDTPARDVGEPPDTTLVVSDDADLRSMAAELLPDLTRRSGLELREPVRVARRSRKELLRYLEGKLDEELPPEKARWMTESYHLLGLVSEDLDLREILLSVYTEQVAAFYDPDSTALFVMDDQPERNLRPVLVHELVHAVQDQATDLDSLTAPARGNDRQVAAQAAIEGHATLVMLEYLTEQARGQPVNLSEIEDFASRIRPALEGLRSQYPELSGAPAVIRESLLFPYLEGAGFIQRFWRTRDGRPSPFGSHLPRSTEQILHPERLLEQPPDEPTDIVLSPGDGTTALYENGLGEMEVRIFLGELAGTGAVPAAGGWDGDRYVLLEDGDGARSLAWYLVWDSAEARDGFLAAVRPFLGSLPHPALAEAMEISGRPVARLRVGNPPEVSAQLSGGG